MIVRQGHLSFTCCFSTFPFSSPFCIVFGFFTDVDALCDVEVFSVPNILWWSALIYFSTVPFCRRLPVSVPTDYIAHAVFCVDMAINTINEGPIIITCSFPWRCVFRRWMRLIPSRLKRRVERTSVALCVACRLLHCGTFLAMTRRRSVGSYDIW